MSKKLVLLIVLLLIVPMALAACGGDDDKEDKKDNGGADLSQSFTSASGVTVEFPEGWVAKDGTSGLTVANSQDAMDKLEAQGDEVPEGAAALISMGAMPVAQLGLAEGAGVKDVLTMMSTAMSGETTSVGDVEEMKLGDRDAAKVSMKDSNTKSEGFIVALKIDDANVLIVAATARDGELGKVEATFMKIIESMTYTAPAG
jgi:hypothetical protein